MNEPPKNLNGYDPTRDADGFEWRPEIAQRSVDFFRDALKLTSGRAAGKPFELQPWQRDFVATLFGWQRADGTRRYREALFFVPRKNGKGLALDTLLPTPAGFTLMRDIAVGDELFDENGYICKVTFVSDVNHRPCYRITFSNGESVVTDDQHRWLTTARIDKPQSGIGNKRLSEGMTRVRTTEEIFRTLICGSRGDRNHSIRIPSALKLPESSLPIEPYALGCWLGDGNARCAAISCSVEDTEHFKTAFENIGYDTRVVKEKTSNRLSFFAKENGSRVSTSSGKTIRGLLRSLNLLCNKHIPRQYLRGSIRQRTELLQGLMDTDGTIAKNGTQLSFCTISNRLCGEVLELLSSLGIKAKAREKLTKLPVTGRTGHAYEVVFAASADDVLCFKLPRKLLRMKRLPGRSRRTTVQIVSVEKVESVPTKCLTVDSKSSLFLFGLSMLPTHNTETGAGLALYTLCCDRENKPEVYSAAKTRDQASRVYEPAAIMVRNSPMLASRLRIVESQKRVVFPQNNGYYCAISADAATSHGKNPHAVLFDELHTQPNRNLYDGLKSGMGARQQPLFVSMTTAGYDRHSICYEVWKHACNVRGGIIRDPHFLPLLYQIEEGDDWSSEDVWKRCNPNLGVTVSIEFLREEFDRACNSPQYENTFRNLYLNQWTEQEVRWFAMDKWDACVGDCDGLQGAPCYAGLDLSSTLDITAFCLVFPIDNRIAIKSWYWVPLDTAYEREKRDRVPYTQWIDDGYIIGTPGRSVDYDRVRADINRIGEQYDIRCLAIDRWNATQLAKQLEGDGFNVGYFGQGFASMSSPSKDFERLVVSSDLIHDGNPVTRWMASNVSVERDAAGNIKPSKKASSEKIDGIVAAVMGLGVMALQNQPNWDESEIGL